jgi:hypothetical protein
MHPCGRVNVPRLTFLTCDTHAGGSLTDDSEVFFRDPAAWLHAFSARPGVPQPSHVVFYSVLEETIAPWLRLHGMTEAHRIRNTHFPVAARETGDLLIWQKANETHHK